MTHTVSSAEFLKSYGQIVEAAMREPVSITSHGRERLVLLSAEEYHRLKRNDRVAIYPWELDNAALEALPTAEPPAEADRFNDEMR